MGKGGGGGGQSRAAARAAEIQAKSQREALEYLKDVDAVPRQFRESALARLGSIYGVDGDTSGQQRFISELDQNPLYQALIGSREAGEEAIARQAAATGGLRSGDTQGAFYDYNTQLQNQALLSAYQDQVSGLQSLAGQPSNANQIASLIQGIGTTQAQGITGAAAAKAAGQQQGFSNLLGLGGLGLSAAAVFSDPRLKKNIKYMFTDRGVKFYSWDWNETANNELALFGSDQGVLTNEHPDCTIEHESGYLAVDYSKIKEKVNAYA